MMRPTHLLVATMLVGLGACSVLRPAPPMDRDAGYRLDRGFSALEAGRYREAFDDLAWVHSHCPGTVRGAHALAGLAALELDPRNESARPDLGTDLLGTLLRGPATADWVRPLANTAYVMALSLGARPAHDPMTAASPAEAPDSMAQDSTAPDSIAPDTLTSDVAAETAEAEAPALAAAPVRAAGLEPAVDEPAHGCGARISTEGWVAPRLPELPGPSLVSLLSAAESSREEASSRAALLRTQLAEARQRLAETEAELERIRRTLRP